MAVLDKFKLEKLTIDAFSAPTRRRATEGIGKFEAMFNPESFSQQYRTRFVPNKSVSSGTSVARFVRSEPASLHLKLVLDGTGVSSLGVINVFGETKTVKRRVEDFLKIAYRVQGKTHEPSYLIVYWGDLNFRCRLAGATINYTTFDRGGRALRAELELELAADDDLERQTSEAALSSPDVSHRRIVASGDTLPLLTQEIYGSPRHYLRVARINGLNSVRQLEPGQELLFPPLAE